MILANFLLCIYLATLLVLCIYDFELLLVQLLYQPVNPLKVVNPLKYKIQNFILYA